MKHAYYLSEDINELETVHDELIDFGFKEDEIHVLSEHDDEVESHHLQAVNPLEKTDVTRTISIGALVGLFLAAFVLAIPYLFNINTPAGNVPFIFAALVLLGFSAWEGGLLGLHQSNHKYEKVMDKLRDGKHLLILDYYDYQDKIVKKVREKHPKLETVRL